MRKMWSVAALVGAMATSGIASADGDHDRARSALERGEVLPLHVIIEKVERAYPGKVVEVELEREHDRWIYELRWLTRGGSLTKIEVDARDGTILGKKGPRVSMPVDEAGGR
ncbi:MAG TPA: PepSY domain-containing protein [Aromatoleum sp.]|uniref:PepSY domain-containing protein n=1 Tax=Aromatoleum sp. TaxID=2307007 RepID=UPI002B467BF2|nr:PepSY domain-containing protein [Aromatoleum sp.]HJV27231.1 PepSY domain-containing protein [Aromatoleum sp.]